MEYNPLWTPILYFFHAPHSTSKFTWETLTIEGLLEGKWKFLQHLRRFCVSYYFPQFIQIYIIHIVTSMEFALPLLCPKTHLLTPTLYEMAQTFFSKWINFTNSIYHEQTFTTKLREERNKSSFIVTNKIRIWDELQAIRNQNHSAWLWYHFYL